MTYARFVVLALIFCVLAGCSSSSPVSADGSPVITDASNQSVPTDTLKINPSATHETEPAQVPQVDDVLVENGFVHRYDLDGVDTCRVEGCKVYENVSIGINVWTYPGGSIILTINTGELYDVSAQETIIRDVTQKLFGVKAASWIIDHLGASEGEVLEADLDGYTITLTVTGGQLGMRLIMLSIIPN